jgi:predicted transcriptional regulator
MYGIRKRGRSKNYYDVENTEYFSENKLYIYKYILNSPGVHLRKLCRELGLAMGDTQYHLSILEKEGRIKSMIIGNHRHYYSVTIPDEQNAMIQDALTIIDEMIRIKKIEEVMLNTYRKACNNSDSRKHTSV